MRLTLRFVRLAWLFVITALLALALPVIAHGQASLTSQVRVHASQNPDTPVVDGATASLESGAGGLAFTFDTVGLEPGDIHTLWVIIVNNPDACSQLPCTPGDVLGNAAAVQTEIVQGAGGQADENGRLTFSGSVPAGALEGGWYGNGLTNPEGAEIHLGINSHGPPIEGMVDDMLSSYRGGCTDESIPPPFPDTARASGTPGPNTCRLVQFAIFMQDAETAPEMLPETGGADDNHAAPLILLLGSVLLAATLLVREREGTR